MLKLMPMGSSVSRAAGIRPPLGGRACAFAYWNFITIINLLIALAIVNPQVESANLSL